MPMRLSLTAVLVRDYDEAIAFYVGKLGFSLAADTDQGGGKRWVVVFLEQPRREPYGTVAVFEDLYGNRWDLIEPKA